MDFHGFHCRYWRSKVNRIYWRYPGVSGYQVCLSFETTKQLAQVALLGEMIQVDLHASNRSYYIVYFISFHTSKGFGHLQAPNITTRTKKKTYLGSGNPSSQNDWLRRALVYFGHILDTPIRIGVSNDRITHFRPSMTRSFNDSFLNPSIVLQPHSPDMIVLLLDLNLETSKLFRFFVD